MGSWRTRYIVSGKGLLETQGGVYSIGRGDSFVIFPDTEVFYYPDANDLWEYLWVEFHGDEVPRLLSMMRLAPDRPVLQVCPVNLIRYFPEDEREGGGPYQRMRSDARLRLLLSHYMEHYRPSDSADGLCILRDSLNRAALLEDRSQCSGYRKSRENRTQLFVPIGACRSPAIWPHTGSGAPATCCERPINRSKRSRTP